ncbi:MAG TPA: hypothetical protein VK874_05905 [Gaiellaceae bacterium]|nr:hypothetical protein [Gaiellaceae bacterium]
MSAGNASDDHPPAEAPNTPARAPRDGVGGRERPAARPYAGAEDGRPVLADRIEGLISQEHAKWV